MKIIFKNEPGKIHDLFHSLYFIYNKNYDDILAKYNLKPNKKVKNALNFLSKKINFESINKDICDLIFNDETEDKFDFFSPKNIWNYSHYSSFLNYIASLDDHKIKFNTIKSFGAFDDNSTNEINEILKSKDKIILWLDTLQLNYDTKWKLLRFMDNPTKWIKDLIQFLESCIPKYEQILKKNENHIDKFSQYVQKGLNDKGLEFIKDLTKDLFNYDDFDEVYVSTLFFNSISTIFSTYENKLHISIGFEFEKTVEYLRGKDEMDIFMNVLKNISDKTRLEILSLLKKEELFGIQLAEKVGVTMATISYHMGYLTTSKLVTQERRGQKFYYSLNKETIRNTLDFLNKYFEL
jgi:DNA-binding transcriptional ArsR family regulator